VERFMLVVIVALVMALAMAGPVFAKSAASDGIFGVGPKQGANYGQCKRVEPELGPGNGNTTAKWNPSYNGGEDLKGSQESSMLCGKR
jgi:hypothetical protein